MRQLFAAIGCVHAPPLHTSVVHVYASAAQDVVLFENMHAPVVVPVHASVVHTFVSAHVLLTSSDHDVALVADTHSLQGRFTASRIVPFE